VTLTTVHFAWAEKLHGYKWASEGANPADAVGNCSPSGMRRTVSAWRAAGAPDGDRLAHGIGRIAAFGRPLVAVQFFRPGKMTVVSVTSLSDCASPAAGSGPAW